jgi:REP element-mobilizing transposase RayT
MLKITLGQLKLFKKSKRGRPRKKGAISHLRREKFAARFPVHVTLRVREAVPNLRQRRCLRAIRIAFLGGNGRFGVRLIHFAVLGNHVHMICEADGELSLSRGMQGLNIRMAKALNRAVERRGRVFSERYHARILRTPTQTRNAVHYVLRNHEKHFGAGAVGVTSRQFPEWVAVPVTWLLLKVPGGFS